MNNLMINNTLLLIGGILCGVLVTIAVLQLRHILWKRKMDEVRPSLSLGYDPENPLNRNYNVERSRRGEKDENGFIRLW